MKTLKRGEKWNIKSPPVGTRFEDVSDWWLELEEGGEWGSGRCIEASNYNHQKACQPSKGFIFY